MVLFKWRLLIFYHPFLVKETRKLMDFVTFYKIYSSVMPTFPTATPKSMTFLSWNLMVFFMVSCFSAIDSPSLMGIGTFPHLFKALPICFVTTLMSFWEARMMLYLEAHFLMAVAFFLKAFIWSWLRQSIPRAVASSQCWTWPRTAICMIRKIWNCLRGDRDMEHGLGQLILWNENLSWCCSLSRQSGVRQSLWSFSQHFGRCVCHSLLCPEVRYSSFSWWRFWAHRWGSLTFGHLTQVSWEKDNTYLIEEYLLVLKFIRF